ncbi:sigma-70 family RNA polymerase sigma factor [Arenibaculum pallidiluteum]|uniref:sigma-70 family RNA polymerase sigma factor n=1 Tax=Arenibaculum pallidiluteum TaxID=2812559 RepID=UPI001A970A58|nr:sigma-70 family RNA polymerase sigma factor [Arenibaculum pallidiluteum]
MDSREVIWAQAMRAERQGDSAAYARFLTEFARSLRRVVRLRFRQLGLGDHETEDIVQEVLIAVHSRRGQWDEERPLLPWLNAIARYKTIDAMRRLRRDLSRRVDLSDEQWSSMFAASESDVETGAMDVEKLIAELPPRQQSTIRVVGIEGASHREAAERLGTSEGAVRVAFHRSLKKLMAIAQRRLEG